MKHSSPSPNPPWQTLAEFVLPGQLGSERLALHQVTEAVQELYLPASHLERLKTALAEAVLNAIEHGGRSRLDLPLLIRVQVSEKALQGCVTEPVRSELAGQSLLRGWSFFLIEKMMDDLGLGGADAHHTIELFLYLEGGNYDSK